MVRAQGISSLQTRNGIGFYQAQSLKATGRVIHAFSTRRGGVSPPPFDSLNLSISTGDDAVNVEKNREILTGAFGLQPSALVTVNQMHGDDILVIDSSLPEDVSMTACDAIITDRPGIAIGVLTADCVPTLVFDPDHLVIATIHSGWKGIAIDLPRKSIRTMIDRFRTQPESLIAAVGPSIGPCCYEVDDRVRAALSGRQGDWPRWTSEVSSNRWMLNICQAIVDLLRESGIRPENIGRVDICTRCQEDLFYSHRRDRGVTGRQGSFIMLE
ncbi:MAG: peptidoglycan editing factor PgeF [Proteobacteria bacterium]|nr:peptidoglycan editing factor PgeF [Pseudomonadota bacterium]